MEQRKVLENGLKIFFMIILAVSAAVLTKGQYNIVLARYPNQDLFWNDLQLFNSYRWFVESFHTNNLFDLFGAFVDFRLGFGQLVLTSKLPNVFLDIGAWLNLALGFEESVTIRYVIFTTLGCYGLLRLCKLNKEYILIWGLLVASLVSLPNFYFEVGLLNQTALLAAPLYYYLMRQYIKFKNGLAAYLFVLVLGMGVSDFHFIIYISTFIILAFVNSGYKAGYIKNSLFLFFITFLIFIANYFPLIDNYLNGEVISSKGSWSLEAMWAVFGMHLFDLNNYIAANFIGPVSVYVPFFVILLIFHGAIINFIKGKPNHKLLNALLVVIFLILAGFIPYLIPVLKNNLPSMVRYHVSIIPLILLITAAQINLDEISIKVFLCVGFVLSLGYGLKLGWQPSISIVVVLLFLTGIIFYFRINSHSRTHCNIYSLGAALTVVLISSIFYDYSKGFANKDFRVGEGYFVNHQIKDSLKLLTPACINNIISKSRSVEGVIFVSLDKDPNSIRARDDFQMFLIENPLSINSRTHNQWRYSLGRHDVFKAENNKLTSLFNFSFPENLQTNIINFAKSSHVSHVISSMQLQKTEDLRLLGRCQAPFGGEFKMGLPQPFANDQYVYEVNNINNYIMKITSAYVELTPSSYFDQRQADVEVPVNFYNSMTVRDMSIGAHVLNKQAKNNSLIVSMGSEILRVGSFNYIYFWSRIFLTFLLVSCFLILLFEFSKNTYRSIIK